MVAERVRVRVQQTVAGDLPPVTISCGLATYPDDALTCRLLTTRAGDAMHAVKAAGRNTVGAWDAKRAAGS